MFRFLTYIIPLVLLAGNLHAQAPAEAEDIRGPKALVEIPVPKKPPVAFWCGIGGGVLLGALAAVLWKRRSRAQHLKTPPQVALASLAELEANRESLAAEAFANRAAQTVRQYISARFGIVAPRRTTEEFLQSLTKDERSPLLGESDHLKAFLKSCDLAKFAGAHLSSAQRGELVETARAFVNSTSNTSAA